jgi:hypothetical protein
LEKLLDVDVELNYETVDEEFYYHYCDSLHNCFRPGLDSDVTVYISFGTKKRILQREKKKTREIPRNVVPPPRN